MLRKSCKMAGESSTCKIDDLLAEAMKDFDLETQSKCDEKPAKNGEVPRIPSLEESLKFLRETSFEAIEAPKEDDLEKLFCEFASAFPPTGASEDSGNILPLMESMMKSIMSKDLLYPPLKEICDKYPDWLANKRPTLSDRDFENYNNQYKIAKELVNVFEAHDNNAYERVLELMQKMQAFGHPPKELMGDARSNPSMDCPVQ